MKLTTLALTAAALLVAPAAHASGEWLGTTCVLGTSDIKYEVYLSTTDKRAVSVSFKNKASTEGTFRNLPGMGVIVDLPLAKFAFFIASAETQMQSTLRTAEEQIPLHCDPLVVVDANP
jgi:hypothetical protein